MSANKTPQTTVMKTMGMCHVVISPDCTSFLHTLSVPPFRSQERVLQLEADHESREAEAVSIAEERYCCVFAHPLCPKSNLYEHACPN